MASWSRAPTPASAWRSTLNGWRDASGISRPPRRRCAPPRTLVSAALRKTMVELRRVWREGIRRTAFHPLLKRSELAGAACSEARPTFRRRVAYARHIVLHRRSCVVAESLDEYPLS